MVFLAGVLPSPAVAPSKGREPHWTTLVPAAATGDRTAVSALLVAIAPRVLAAIRRVLGSGSLAADAEDVMQESLISVVRALGSLREPQALLRFAVRTAVRDALRHRKPRANAPQTVELQPDAQGGDDVDATVIARRKAQVLLSLLDELPEEQSEALALRFCLGHSLEEAAAIMGCPVNTVRSRVRLGRAALAQKLSKRAGPRELLGGDNA